MEWHLLALDYSAKSGTPIKDQLYKHVVQSLRKTLAGHEDDRKLGEIYAQLNLLTGKIVKNQEQAGFKVQDQPQSLISASTIML